MCTFVSICVCLIVYPYFLRWPVWFWDRSKLILGPTMKNNSCWTLGSVPTLCSASKLHLRVKFIFLHQIFVLNIQFIRIKNSFKLLIFKLIVFKTPTDLSVSILLRTQPLSPAPKTRFSSSVFAPLRGRVKRTHFVNVFVICVLETLTRENYKLVFITWNKPK